MSVSERRFSTAEEYLKWEEQAFDRGNKFLHYQTLPSLKEYILVSQQQRLVEIFQRQGNHRIYEALEGNDAVLKLDSVQCQIASSEIFRNVAFVKRKNAPSNSSPTQ